MTKTFDDVFRETLPGAATTTTSYTDGRTGVTATVTTHASGIVTTEITRGEPWNTTKPKRKYAMPWEKKRQ